MSEGRVIGSVSTFDEYVGLGTVSAVSGEQYPFHCTQIAGGSRTIEVGQSVTFVVVQRHKGPEAYDITKS